MTRHNADRREWSAEEDVELIRRRQVEKEPWKSIAEAMGHSPQHLIDRYGEIAPEARAAERHNHGGRR